MRFTISILVIFSFLITPNCLAQEKTRKQIKEENRIEIQKQLDTLIDSREFIFKATSASAMGYKPVGLTPNTNYMSFDHDLVISQMPYFGNSYGNIGFGIDEGLKFEGIPENYTVKKGKKSYQIKVTVKSQGNAYKLIITVRFDGVTSLSVSSNNRSNIIFDGYLTSLDIQEIKQ